MSRAPYRELRPFRVRIDDCDRSRSITPGRLFALADEARFDLYEDLGTLGVTIPERQSAKAERLVVRRLPRRRESITIEAFLGRVGRTSFDVDHVIRDASGATIAELTSTVVAIADGRPAPCDPSLSEHVAPSLGLAADVPHEPDGSVAFLRTLDAWPSHENTGAHVARTRMVDWLVDAYRLGLARGAFEHPGANEAAEFASISLVYEKESFSGDGLRIAIASAACDVFDASLVRSGAIVTRARIRTRSAL